MRRRNASDGWLLVPAAFLLISLVLPVGAIVTAPSPESDGFFGFADLYSLLFALLIAAPFFVAGFIWLLAALARRRPIRQDVVGWLLCVPLGLLCAAMAFVGTTFAAIDLLSGGPSPFIWITAGLGGVGLFGLFIVVMSLVPRRQDIADGGSPEP